MKPMTECALNISQNSFNNNQVCGIWFIKKLNNLINRVCVTFNAVAGREQTLPIGEPEV